MMPILALAQYPITAFQSFGDWKQHIHRWIEEAASNNADLLLFPEYGAMELTSLLPGQDLTQQISGMETLREAFIETFAEAAQKHQVLVVAPSFPVREGNKVFNRSYVFSSKGLAGFQDKLFMTRFENEDWGIDAALPILHLFEAPWGSFGIQTCYDVEFSIGSQLLCHAGASLILAPSCTETIRGAARVHIGAQARALENQCHVAVSQTVGESLWSPAVDINYGYAAVYAPPDLDMPEMGIVARKTPQEPGWLTQSLDFEKIKTVRDQGQVFNFKDHRRVEQLLDGKAPKVKRVLL